MGRPRKHADHAARTRAWRQRDERRDETPPPRDEIRDETPPSQAGRDEKRDETSGARNLRARLWFAAQGNFDRASDIAPIRALLAQGCDLEADVVPIVARELPELPRPLKNWGAPWLGRDILAARDQRLRSTSSRLMDGRSPRL
jgi:hypothetical protein